MVLMDLSVPPELHDSVFHLLPLRFSFLRLQILLKETCILADEGVTEHENIC